MLFSWNVRVEYGRCWTSTGPAAALLRIRKRIVSSSTLVAMSSPLAVSALTAFLSGLFAQYEVVLVLFPVGALLAAFFSRSYPQAVFCALFLYTVHYAVMGALPYSLLPLPGIFILNPFFVALVSASLLAHYCGRNEFRDFNSKAAGLIGLAITAGLVALPFLEPRTAYASFILSVDANVIETNGLALVLPLPLVNRAIDKGIFSYPRELCFIGGVECFKTDYTLTMVSSEFGPAVKIEIDGLSARLGPAVFDPLFRPHSNAYGGSVRFTMSVPYQPSLGGFRIEFNNKTNVNRIASFVGGSASPDTVESFVAPIWVSVPSGLEPRIALALRYSTGNPIDAFSPAVLREEFVDDRVLLYKPSGSGWMFVEGSSSVRSSVQLAGVH